MQLEKLKRDLNAEVTLEAKVWNWILIFSYLIIVGAVLSAYYNFLYSVAVLPTVLAISLIIYYHIRIENQLGNDKSYQRPTKRQRLHKEITKGMVNAFGGRGLKSLVFPIIAMVIVSLFALGVEAEATYKSISFLLSGLFLTLLSSIYLEVTDNIDGFFIYKFIVALPCSYLWTVVVLGLIRVIFIL